MADESMRPRAPQKSSPFEKSRESIIIIYLEESDCIVYDSYILLARSLYGVSSLGASVYLTVARTLLHKCSNSCSTRARAHCVVVNSSTIINTFYIFIADPNKL
jgi:hypothetical protein